MLLYIKKKIVVCMLLIINLIFMFVSLCSFIVKLVSYFCFFFLDSLRYV